MKNIASLLLALAGLSFAGSVRSTAGTLTQDFSADPAGSGWQAFGNTNLFLWDSTNQDLRVTWDSTQPNSYFYHPLGTILARDDDFSLAFDVRLDDIGPADSFEYSFAVAIGFINLDQATSPAFLRGTGFNATNLVELAYFRDDPFGDPATVYPTFVDRDGQFNYNPGGTDSTNFALTPGEWYHLAITYTASNQTMLVLITNLSTSSRAQVIHPLGSTFGGSPFTDFRVNAISINSYSEAGQYPGYEGSVLAHGTVDNIFVTVPPPPAQGVVGAFNSALWQGQFLSRSNWLYTLERTTDFQSWTNITTASGNATNLFLQDTNPPADQAFYRISAQRP